jgi:hypothetical protein
MEKETLEEGFIRTIIPLDYTEADFASFKLGIKYQQEKDRDFYFKYIKSEKDFQMPRMDKLGINTTGQIFEQMVTSLIHLAERSYSEEEVKELLGDFFYDHINSQNANINDWFEQFKKK